MSALGWVFCEIAFRGWNAMPESAFYGAGTVRWWARPLDGLLEASYRLGCFFYGRAA